MLRRIDDRWDSGKVGTAQTDGFHDASVLQHEADAVQPDCGDDGAARGLHDRVVPHRSGARGDPGGTLEQTLRNLVEHQRHHDDDEQRSQPQIDADGLPETLLWRCIAAQTVARPSRALHRSVDVSSGVWRHLHTHPSIRQKR
ncbi:MAG: hypothetical protein M3Y32_02850 [Pseudomonadota bacterium]|nr:hypothetical protein [Pseudomonadota bacterium]